MLKLIQLSPKRLFVYLAADEINILLMYLTETPWAIANRLSITAAHEKCFLQRVPEIVENI